MYETKKRLIIVLGMHRSGTSAVARGLQVMGVELGNRLIPGIENNNPKGFWEDWDLTQLNNEMLGALGSAWHYLAPVGPLSMDVLQENGYFSKAAELLFRKAENTSLFGFKDPRTAKLLPFWKRVAARCELDTSFVLAVRHPLSVAQSLAKRDGFDIEKGYFLWLGHVIESLAGSEGFKRVLIDYDKLMTSPELQLIRIAKQLDLKIDEVELQRYKSEFLDSTLQHTIHSFDELAADDACPPLAREVYETLLDISSEKVLLEDAALHDRITRWIDEYERLAPILTLVDKLVRWYESTDQVAALKGALVKHEAQISTLSKEINMAQAEIEVARKKLEGVYDSNSWKITAPLRSTRRLIASFSRDRGV